MYPSLHNGISTDCFVPKPVEILLSDMQVFTDKETFFDDLKAKVAHGPSDLVVVNCNSVPHCPFFDLIAGEINPTKTSKISRCV